MALPFLPPDLILSTYNEIDHQYLDLDEATIVKIYIQNLNSKKVD